jgi:hypothetical protein
MQMIQRVLCQICFLLACLMFGFSAVSVVTAQVSRNNLEAETTQCPDCIATKSCGTNFKKEDCTTQTVVDSGEFGCKAKPKYKCIELVLTAKCCPYYDCTWDDMAKTCSKPEMATGFGKTATQYLTEKDRPKP